MRLSYQDPRNGSHCESCGAADPQTDQGYTTCCNELTCDGTHQDAWVIGTMTGPDDTRTVTGRLNACCASMADRKAALTGPGVLALCRAH